MSHLSNTATGPQILNAHIYLQTTRDHYAYNMQPSVNIFCLSHQLTDMHCVACACRNIGHDIKRPTTRVYATPLAQPMHTDSADIVALLSLKLSKEGGLSSWSSSVSVHNELLKLGRKVGAPC